MRQAVAGAVWLLLLGGCATVPLDSPAVLPPTQAVPALTGSYHQVRRGDTLWRIARSYGISVQGLAAANRISRTAPIEVGQQLFIPLPPESAHFLWPLRGTVASGGGYRGVQIAAAPGSLIRASRTGRVVVAARQLSGWGKTVVLDHLDGQLSIYAGMDQLLVAPGALLRQGTPLGRLGTGQLHFEIRSGAQPKNTLALLPQ